MGWKWATVAFVAFVALAVPGTGSGSPSIRYGIKDDAWLAFGPGTLPQRVGMLDELGVTVVRYTLRWDEIATTRPKYPRWSGSRAYTWGSSDRVLKALNARHVQALVGIWGAPGWANAGRGPNFAPIDPKDMRDFAHAAAQRFPWVRRWLIWNEPNQPRFLRPTSPGVYVQRILNPAYIALHTFSAANRVGAGVTAPRGQLSPVTWIRRMRIAGAKLDAYAHNPYPEDPHVETPTSGGCGHCLSITMATLGRLERETANAWGPIPLWLTEYGYQTNPPDRSQGVPPATEARYEGEAALRAYRSPRVDMLVHFLLRDETRPAGWQSGLFTATGRPKPAARAFPFPLVEASRQGAETVLWGQVRSHHGARPYRLQQFGGDGWDWVGGTRRTNARGFFLRSVSAGPGARFRVYSALDRKFGITLVVR